MAQREEKSKHPCDPILLPSGRGVMCPNDPCYGRKIWNPAKRESPNCIKCAAAWSVLERGAN